MLTKKYFLLVLALCCLNYNSTLLAVDEVFEHHHGRRIFHAFELESAVGDSKEGQVQWVDLDGWIGSDYHKLWLKTEFERIDSQTDTLETWGLYSRYLSTFWDAQIGIRHDAKPHSLFYFVFGLEGLASYFIETEFHIFLSEKGDVSARLHLERDFLITQQWVFQPFLETEIFFQNVPDLEAARGISGLELGLQCRYKITPKVAPYLEVRYERKIGGTAALARSHSDAVENVLFFLGIKFLI